jgi:DNA-binding FadR family transcriptional regulator
VAVVTDSGPAARARPVRPESIRRTEDWGMAVQAWPTARATSEELIRVQATAARVACGRMTTLALQSLRDSVERASCLPSRPRWESKVAAHAEIFQLLADAAGSPAATDPKSSQVRVIRDMMRTVGPVANGIITGSRRRLLACLDAGNADGAAQEMESHLRALHFMALLVPHQ